VRAGDTYKYYDLASLTKIIFTATASMQYFSGRRGELTRPVREKIDWLKLKVTPQQLLTHTAGLEWWLPMYKKFRGTFDPPERWAQMEDELAKLKPKRRTQAVYSDPDLWLMGAFLREACGFELLDLWDEVSDRAGVRDVFFHPKNRPRHPRRLYAPTERCSWRGKVLRGEVHDEGGVAGAVSERGCPVADGG
jgi:CubicO group peptidase (beta-lactamase class C family)